MNDTYKRRCPTLIIKGWFCDNMYLWNNNKLLTTHVVVENMQRLICFLTAVHKKISHNVHKVTENHLHLHLLLGILGYILWCWKLLFPRENINKLGNYFWIVYSTNTILEFRWMKENPISIVGFLTKIFIYSIQLICNKKGFGNLNTIVINIWTEP